MTSEADSEHNERPDDTLPLRWSDTKHARAGKLPWQPPGATGGVRGRPAGEGCWEGEARQEVMTQRTGAADSRSAIHVLLKWGLFSPQKWSENTFKSNRENGEDWPTYWGEPAL